jgi:hypothetical protein
MHIIFFTLCEKSGTNIERTKNCLYKCDTRIFCFIAVLIIKSSGCNELYSETVSGGIMQDNTACVNLMSAYVLSEI